MNVNPMHNWQFGWAMRQGWARSPTVLLSWVYNSTRLLLVTSPRWVRNSLTELKLWETRGDSGSHFVSLSWPKFSWISHSTSMPLKTSMMLLPHPLNVTLTLSVHFSNFDSPLRMAFWLFSSSPWLKKIFRMLIECLIFGTSRHGNLAMCAMVTKGWVKVRKVYAKRQSDVKGVGE